jgi:hypothetical protein
MAGRRPSLFYLPLDERFATRAVSLALALARRGTFFTFVMPPEPRPAAVVEAYCPSTALELRRRPARARPLTLPMTWLAAYM